MTQQNNTPSLRSPKNRYHVEIHFQQPIDGIGNVTSFGTMSLEGVDDYIRKYWMYDQPVVRVIIRENMKTYPSFDWKTVRNEDLKA